MLARTDWLEQCASIGVLTMDIAGSIGTLISDNLLNVVTLLGGALAIGGC